MMDIYHKYIRKCRPSLQTCGPRGGRQFFKLLFLVSRDETARLLQAMPIL